MMKCAINSDFPSHYLHLFTSNYHFHLQTADTHDFNLFNVCESSFQMLLHNIYDDELVRVLIKSKQINYEKCGFV